VDDAQPTAVSARAAEAINPTHTFVMTPGYFKVDATKIASRT
jgi:hypothetical protein